jgi:hypothetical protein
MTPPDDFFQSEAVRLMLVQVIVEQSGNHVVCGGNGVKVARKVQVYLLHGQHLGISSTGSTAFHAEART